MIVTAWRIVKAKHAASSFSGEGAGESGGRWNSPGVAVVYTAGSTSLAMLEMLVHLQSQELLKRYLMIEVEFDDSLLTKIAPSDLPRTWRRSPPPAAIQRIGDDWVAESESAVLRVPSVIAPTEWNYLLNPAHSNFAKIVVGPKRRIHFDPRLIKSSRV